MIFIITLEEVKQALRIDYDDEDPYLQICIDASEAYLESAIDDYEEKIKDNKFQHRAKIIIIMTTQNLFDERSYTSGIYQDKIKFIVQSLMAQMRWE